MGDAWHVNPSTTGLVPSLLAQSTLDSQTIDDIMAGRRPFPNYGDIPLPAERLLRHELIVQAVTERRIDVGHIPGQPSKYDEKLAVVIDNISSSKAYQALSAKGHFTREDVSKLLDDTGLERLLTVESGQRTTLMMATGGPATGKSELVRTLGEQYPDIFRDAARINTDDYKPLLASQNIYGSAYANIAHAESALVSDKIIERLSEKIAEGHAPNIVLDVVTLNDQRIAFAKESGQLIVATGTAPPEETVQRSYDRGLETQRVVPTEAVLAGAKVVAMTTPRIFEHPQTEMTLYDTNVPRGTAARIVAEWRPDLSALVINNPDTFVDFVERQNLDPKATSPEQLFTAEARSPERIAEGLAAYTERGVTLAMLDGNGNLAMTINRNGVEERLPLTSSRGAGFFAELAIASRAVVASRSLSPDERATVPHEAEGKPVAHATRSGAIATGVGLGLGAKGIYDDLTEDNSPLYRDLNAGGTQAVVGGARLATQAADVVIGTAAAVDGTYRAVTSRTAEATTAVAPKLAEMGPVAKFAGRAALPLAIGAGALEATAGVLEDNPERVAGAVGSTGGGILGGIVAGAAAGGVAGAVTGSPGGPVAVGTAFVGALGGAVAGAYFGEEAAKTWLTDATATAMKALGSDEPAKAPAMSSDMQRALEAVKGLSLSSDIKCDNKDASTIVHGLGAMMQPVEQRGACR